MFHQAYVGRQHPRERMLDSVASDSGRLGAFGVAIVAADQIFGEVLVSIREFEELRLALRPFRSSADRGVLQDGFFICVLAGEKGIWEPVQVESPIIFALEYCGSPLAFMGEDSVYIVFTAKRTAGNGRIFRGAP